MQEYTDIHAMVTRVNFVANRQDRHGTVTHLHVGSISGADLRPRLLVVDTSTIDVAFPNGVCPVPHWEECWELRGTIPRVIKSLVVTRP